MTGRRVGRTQAGRLAALRASRDEAVALARARARFVSHASHEIRTPLHGIVGYSTLLAGTDLTEEQHTLADALGRSIDSLMSVVNDVLDLSRIDAGAMRLDAATFDLLPLVRGVADLFAETARAKGVLLGVDTHGLTCRHLTGDPGRIRQVLGNLVANAIKFTDEGAVTLCVGTRRRRGAAVHLDVSVADTGPGIPRGARRQLFQPFSRIAPGKGHDKPGAGLGLAICRELVTLMGGTIRVKSVPGRGSTFSFRVSLEEAAPPVTAREGQSFDAGGLQVYVADDDLRSRREIQLALVSSGIAVAGSGTAAASVDALRAADAAGALPDLVIVGHVRHEGADLAVARAIASDLRLARVPLVLVPLGGVRGHAREAADAGYCAYVPRPFRGDELRECVATVVLQARVKAEARSQRLITRHHLADGRSTAPGRVLVADDDHASRDVTRLQVERLGFAVDTVSRGGEAVTAALTGDYRVVLLDCQMPDMDGPTAAANIRRREPAGRRTTVVALTADVGVGTRERCRRAGMDGFLEKPVRTDTLARLLQQHGRAHQKTAAPGHATAAHVGPVHESAIGPLEVEIGADNVVALVQDYVSNVEQALVRLDMLDTAACDDLRRVRAEAHRLLGSARILGLSAFERLWRPLAERAERGGRTWSPARSQAARRACEELRSWIADRMETSHV